MFTNYDREFLDAHMIIKITNFQKQTAINFSLKNITFGTVGK